MAFGSKNRIRVQAGVEGVPQAAGELNKFRAAFDGVANSKGGKAILSGVGMGAGISAFNLLEGAIRSAFGAIGDGIQKAKDEQVGIDRLTTSLEANVRGWDGNTASIEETIVAREKLAFSDGEQRDSLALLVPLTKAGTTALDLERTAMDLARLRKLDLAQASEIVSKVYGGNVSILTRYGIAVRKGSSATEALAQIQAAAAGQAEKFGDSAEGAAQGAQIALEDLQEEISVNFLPVVRDVSTWVRDEGVPAMRGLVEALGWAGAAFGGTKREVVAFREEAERTGLYWQLTGQQIAGGMEAIDVHSKEAAQSLVDFRAGEREAASALGDLAATSEDTAGEIAKDNRTIRSSFRETADYLLNRYTGNFDTAMGIVEARSALYSAKTDEDRVAAYADLAALGAVSQKGYTQWIAALERLAKGTKGKVHDAYMAAIRDIQALKAAAAGNIKVQVTYKSPRPGQAPVANATGGYIPPDTYGTVGEEGIEGIHMLPGGGAYVTSRDQFTGGRGGGRESVVVHTHINLDGREIARVVDRHLYYEAARAPRS